MEWNGTAIMENHATNNTAHERRTCGSGCTYPTIGAGMEVICESHILDLIFSFSMESAFILADEY